MKCSRCGAEVAENVVICHVCGERVEPEGEPTPEPAEPRAEPDDAAVPLSEEEPKTPAGESPPAPRTPETTGSVGAGQREEAGAREQVRGTETLWQGRYALRDMNVIWINTILITAVFVALGVWISTSGWVPQWLGQSIFWGIILLIPVVLWVYQVCRMLHRWTIRYRLTPHRLYFREGILVRREEALELVAIEDLSNTQTLVERLICGGVGTVHVHSKDPTDPVLRLRGLIDYQRAFEQIDLARRKERQRRGLALI